MGLVAGFALPLTELLAVTVTLDVWTRLPARAARAPSPAVLAGYGALTAATLLCKLNTGVIIAVAVGVLVLAWPGWAQRVRAAAVAGASAVATGLVLWLTTGSELAGIGPWLRAAVETTTSYASAMAMNPPTAEWTVLQLVLLSALVALVAVGLRAGWRDMDRTSRWPEVALVVSLAWFTLKAGLVRFDRSHVDFPLAALAILAVVFGTASRSRWMPAAAILLATVGLVAGYDSIVGGNAERLVDRRLDQPEQVLDAVQAAVSVGAYRDQTAQAQEEIREFYRDRGLTDPVVEALEGRRVHAEQWDVAALWAYGLDWRPLPVFQTYAAFSSWLDERNVDALEDADEGPDAVLRNAVSIDRRVGTWDSPSARLAMACEFETVADDGMWSALHRAENLCEAPREIGRVHAPDGEEIAVPTARPGELVVASFELDPSLAKRAMDLVARDPHLPFVHVDGVRARFVPDAADRAARAGATRPRRRPRPSRRLDWPSTRSASRTSEDLWTSPSTRCRSDDRARRPGRSPPRAVRAPLRGPGRVPRPGVARADRRLLLALPRRRASRCSTSAAAGGTSSTRCRWPSATPSTSTRRWPQRLDPEVQLHTQAANDPWPLADESLDLVFTSNFLEHLPGPEAVMDTLAEAHRCLRPGGRIVCMGPNIRVVNGTYWDFFDHVVALTERSMAEALELSGFEVESAIARFVPYTMVGKPPRPPSFVRAVPALPAGVAPARRAVPRGRPPPRSVSDGPTRLLVTGGAGFIGSNLCVQLKARHPDWEVVAADNLYRRGSELNLPRLEAAGVEFVRADVRNPDDLDAAGDFTALVECSAEPSVLGDRSVIVDVNLMGAYHCFEAARAHGAQVVFLSSSRVYPVAALEALRLDETDTRFELSPDQATPGASDARHLRGVPARRVAHDVRRLEARRRAAPGRVRGAVGGEPLRRGRRAVADGEGGPGRVHPLGAEPPLRAAALLHRLRRHREAGARPPARGRPRRPGGPPAHRPRPLERPHLQRGRRARRQPVARSRPPTHCQRAHRPGGAGDPGDSSPVPATWPATSPTAAPSSPTPTGDRSASPVDVLRDIDDGSRPTRRSCGRLWCHEAVRRHPRAQRGRLHRRHGDHDHRPAASGRASTTRSSAWTTRPPTSTAEEIKRLAADDERVRYLASPYPNGFGLAVRAGLEVFEGDYVAVMMADLSDDPDDLVAYVRLLEAGYDCAFGSRFMAGGHTVGLPPAEAHW